MIESVISVAYGRPATDALDHVIRSVKSAEGALAPVTVVVPSNLAGLFARRLLGARRGLANVQFVTPFRFAELLSADIFVDRRPLTNAVLASAVRSALAADPRPFGETAQHHATEAAVAALFARVSHLSATAREALAADPAGSMALDLHGRVGHRLTGFDDEDDVARAARNRGDLAAALEPFGHIVWYLPERLSHELSELVRMCLLTAPSTVIAGLTGVDETDAAVLAVCDRAGVHIERGDTAIAPASGSRIVTATDADEEIREVVRSVWTLAAHGMRLDRIAVVYPSAAPYLRVLRAQFEAADLPVSGPAPERLADLLAGRVLVGALDLPASGWRRDHVTNLVASGPLRGGGQRVRPAAWERMSRQAGVVAGLADWRDKLDRSARSLRRRAEVDRAENEEGDVVSPPRRLVADASATESLLAFVDELAGLVAAVVRAQTWADRCREAQALLTSLLGADADRQHWPEHEQLGADRVVDALGRLATLGESEPSPSLDDFRRAVDAELDAPGPRLGRFGTGVALVPLAGAVGLDVEAVFVVGMAEGMCPRARRDESLLPESARLLTGGELETPDDALAGQHRRLLAALASAPADRRVLTFARGDLRGGRSQLPSRWLLDTATALRGTRLYSSELEALQHPAVEHIESFAAGVRDRRPAASEVEHDLATLVAGADPLVYPPTLTVRQAIVAQRARRSDAFTAWDGNLGGLGVASPVRLDAVSPTRLETWATCGFRYFLQHVLHLEEVETPERIVELQPLDRGSAFHDVLETFLAEVIATSAPAPDQKWSLEQRTRLHELADAEFDRIERAGKTGRRLLWQRRRRELHTRLERFLDDDETERASRRTAPSRVEWSFGGDEHPPVAVELGDGRAVRFRGRVDRIDVAAEGSCVVYDYKTGSGKRYVDLQKDAGGDVLGGGTMLQHGIYAEAARQALGLVPSASRYWLVDRDDSHRIVGVPWGDDERRRLGEVTGAIVDGIEAGAFPVVPGDWDTWRQTHANCAHCAFDRLCVVDRGEHADAKAVEIAVHRHDLGVEADPRSDAARS